MFSLKMFYSNTGTITNPHNKNPHQHNLWTDFREELTRSTHSQGSNLGAALKVGMVTCWYKNVSMENYSRNLIKMLERKGIDIEIITSHCICRNRFPQNEKSIFGEGRIASFPYIYKVRGSNFLSKLTHFMLNLLKGINYLSKSKGCHIIHYQQSNYYSFGFIPLLPLLLVPTGQKVIVTIHNFDRFQRRFKFLNKVYMKAQKIIVHSSDMKRKAERIGIPDEKINVIFHGANIVSLMKIPRTEMTFFGAPERRKGFFVLIKALGILRNRMQPLKLHIYGISSKEEEERAKSKARNIGVDKYLIWGGPLEENEFDQKLQASLFTISPFVAPVSGSSVITRAMANGTPVISTKVGGVPEYLGGSGILVPPNNPQLLADAMELLYNNGELRKELGKKAYDRANRLLSWASVSEEVIKVYSNSF